MKNKLQKPFVQTLISAFIALAIAFIGNNYYVPKQIEENYKINVLNELFLETSNTISTLNSR
ncbi:hypothetical protein [Aquimarina longa]|uniref:hypothetical protein n=1 Tax=Aquimarina longa TaxID=1080221 RepID=UPI000784C994|nr:hypothetical protein [Aquimarina longa]